jgi:hypothetical protein
VQEEPRRGSPEPAASLPDRGTAGQQDGRGDGTKDGDKLYFLFSLRFLIVLTCGAPIHTSKRISFLPHQLYRWAHLLVSMSIRD